MGRTAPETLEPGYPRPFELLYTAQVLKDISRDFNNLLTCIQGHVSLMLLDMDTRYTGYQNLKDIEKCVQKGATLTKRLSTTGEAIKPKKETVKLNDLIRAQFHDFGKRKGRLVIRQRYHEGIWSAKAPPEDIARIIRILRDDVFRGITAGGEVYLRTQNVTLSDAYVRPYGLRPGKFVKISIAYNDSGEGGGRSVVSDRVIARIHEFIKQNDGFLNTFVDEENVKTVNLYFPA